MQILLRFWCLLFFWCWYFAIDVFALRTKSEVICASQFFSLK